MPDVVGEAGSTRAEFAERMGRDRSSWSSCLWCMTKRVCGGVLAMPGRRPGCFALECAGLERGGGCR
jgi:hypothetical protein